MFGSLNADLVFQVEALPRPGETVLCPGYALAAGGKGANQAAAAAKAGAAVRMVGHVGDDSFGQFLRHGLVAGRRRLRGRRDSRPRDRRRGDRGRPRRPRTRSSSAAAPISTPAPARSTMPMLRPGVTLLCQNEVRPGGDLRAARARQGARGARTILNLAPAAPVPGAVLDALDVLVVNEIEAAMAAGGPGPAIRRIWRATWRPATI